jgi:hypothetical protein
MAMKNLETLDLTLYTSKFTSKTVEVVCLLWRLKIKPLRAEICRGFAKTIALKIGQQTVVLRSDQINKRGACSSF